MVYGLTNSCIKTLVFITNLLICIGGLLIFGIALWANLDKDFSSHIAKFVKATDVKDGLDSVSQYQAALWILVGVGGLLFLLGFFGCCGAACESTILLTLFSIIVMILLVIEIGAASFAVSHKDEFKENVQNILEKGANSSEGKVALRDIQNAFNCCGPSKEKMEPMKFNCTEEQVQHGDCFTVMWDAVNSVGSWATWLAFFVVLIEVLAVIASCSLCRAFRDRDPAYYA